MSRGRFSPSFRGSFVIPWSGGWSWQEDREVVRPKAKAKPKAQKPKAQKPVEYRHKPWMRQDEVSVTFRRLGPRRRSQKT
jgi:hypothetical protein